eukprot:1565276-Rhodomonas_salina.2
MPVMPTRTEKLGSSSARARPPHCSAPRQSNTRNHTCSRGTRSASHAVGRLVIDFAVRLTDASSPSESSTLSAKLVENWDHDRGTELRLS